MERWDLASLKVFLNESFRPRKLLAQKDAELAELRGDWVKVHEAFRLSQEALAQSQAQLAELRDDWVKVHEAFQLSQQALVQKGGQIAELRKNWAKDQEALRLSQEAIAQREARLAELGNHWTNVLAEKDAELAQSREHWNTALRLSQEAVAQRDARLAELADHWTKVLAEKDAELAQSGEHWNEALRLSQEAVAQKDAYLAELRVHWVKVLAEKDAELAQSREHWNEALRLSREALDQKEAELAQSRQHWNEALRLSQEAMAQKDAELAQSREQWKEALRLSQETLAQKNAELVMLRGGEWTTPEGRAYRAGLKVQRARFPWVGVFAPLKSASTFVWVALARLLNADRLVFNVVDRQAPGVQLMHELDPIRMRDPRLQDRSIVFRMHVPASQHTLFHVRDLLIPAVVCSRDLFDCLVSVREELVKQWSDREHMLVTRERGGHEVFMGTVPIQIIEHFMRVEPDRQIDMVIELAALWYLQFYQSWRCAKERYPNLIYVCNFETLTTGGEAAMRDILAFLNHPVDYEAISRVVSALMHDHAEINFNVGISGRGRQIMSCAQIDRVMSIARTVGAEDLVGGL